MKRLLLFALIGITLAGCKKLSSSELPSNSELSSYSLAGNWRMISVLNNSTGIVTTKPSTIQGDVDIRIVTISPASGTFTGNTPSNEFGKNDYSIGTSQTISIPSLSMTKVAETSWGSLFVDNIRASNEYTFEAENILKIKTSNNLTLTFRKL